MLCQYYDLMDCKLILLSGCFGIVAAMSLNGFEGKDATSLGSMLFTRCVSGVRYDQLQLTSVSRHSVLFAT